MVFFTTLGLQQGRLLGTEALTSLLIYITKTSTFWTLGSLYFDMAKKGFLVGIALMAGAFAGKAVVKRISDRQFRVMLDCFILVSGVLLLAYATLR